MSKPDKQPIFSGAPEDQSLEAYQRWIRGITAGLGGSDTMTEAEWKVAWREFWGFGEAEGKSAAPTSATPSAAPTSEGRGKMETEAGDLILTERFTRAVEYARQVHREYRKGTRVPYLAHLLGVASLVMGENGYLSFPVTEDICIAALLHDVVEDHGGWARLREVEERFGPDVAAMVGECSDTFVADAGQKETWAERKAAYVERLRQASPATLLVSAADKLHNARSMLEDYRAIGAEIWKRFKAGREQQLAYYHRLTEVYSGRGPNRIVAELERVIRDLEQISQPD